MKYLFATVITVLAMQANATQKVECVSFWIPEGKVLVTGNWSPGSSLENLDLQTEFESGSYNYSKQNADTEKVKYNPRNPRYKGMDRFQIVDQDYSGALSVLLPKQLEDQTESFKGFFYVADEGTTIVELICEVVNE